LEARSDAKLSRDAVEDFQQKRGGGQRRLNPGVIVALPEDVDRIRVVQNCADPAETL